MTLLSSHPVFAVDDWFEQVDKVYALADGCANIPVYANKASTSKTVGVLPYYGLAYVLEKDGSWSYIESGEVRGFVENKYLDEGAYVDELIRTIGEDAFSEGYSICDISENAAYTYTNTTVQNVAAGEKYALFMNDGGIYEYTSDQSREVGDASSGCVFYILENVDETWIYGESGNVRGFVKKEVLLSGTNADRIIESETEENLFFAKELLSPEQNRNFYYSKKSVHVAVADIGLQIAEKAKQYIGQLPYVYGGTDLTYGADCSGFTQSLFAMYGINIPRIAEEQGVNGKEIYSLSEARPGDLIYWESGPHIGIYIGDGQVVQCSGDSYNDEYNPGPGPMISDADYMPITSIRRYAEGKVVSSKQVICRGDNTTYSDSDMELIWAIVAQEDCGSYEGALAVISSAMNRVESSRWSYCGSNVLEQLTAPGQYCYSIDDYWRNRLGGNVPDYVKEAVYDCLVKGVRNHSYTCFRSMPGSETGSEAVQIGNGGNWYFGN